MSKTTSLPIGKWLSFTAALAGALDVVDMSAAPAKLSELLLDFASAFAGSVFGVLVVANAAGNSLGVVVFLHNWG
jgi:hypothetical protein